MEYPIKYGKFKSSLEFYSEVITLYNEAHNYLLGFKWCAKTIDCDLYINLGSVLCVFAFKVENTDSNNDDSLWVIVGDLPPMYLDTHGARTTKEALEDYFSLASDWVAKIKNEESIKDCYPFNAKPTIEMATILENKVSFLRDTVIDNIEEIAFAE